MHRAFAGDQAGNSKLLALSSLLPDIADGQALKVKVAEAHRIVLQLDKETLAEKLKLPNVNGVFDPINLGLAKPAKPNEYGGGMSSRLEFIEKNLAKSLHDLAKLPSACDAAHQAQWKAASASLQLLLKTITQAKQARVQATWTAKESDKLIQAALARLRGANDKASVRELESYNKKLQDGLDAAAKALGKGLAGKSLDKKVMPKLGGKCGSVQAIELPTQKEAGMQLAGKGSTKAAGSARIAAKSDVVFASADTSKNALSKPESTKLDVATQSARGGESYIQKGSTVSLAVEKGRPNPHQRAFAALAAAIGSPMAPAASWCDLDDLNYKIAKASETIGKIEKNIIMLGREPDCWTDCLDLIKAQENFKNGQQRYLNSLLAEKRKCEGPTCAERGIGIEGPADLILFKPSGKSPTQSFRVTAKVGSITKVQWSTSSNKVTVQGRTDQTTVKIRPSLESGRAGDVAVAVDVDGCSAQRKLTVRRPASLEHGTLKYGRFQKKRLIFFNILYGGTDGKFIWTLKDQLSKPLGGTEVIESVWCDQEASNVNCRTAGFLWPFSPWPEHQKTDSAGLLGDTYGIALSDLPPTHKVTLHQKLISNGYNGTTDVVITESSVVGTSPVELK
ncbi:MAG: hypothetical protein HY922_16365 [Elusimicrobia bacterium]|nr:hypothetical protein [Elusimicrobiota bacterium]